jgi:putative GTP pyrophosphokinase
MINYITDINKIEQEHKQLEPVAKIIHDKLRELLQRLVDENDIKLAVPFRTRVKELWAILDKGKNRRFQIRQTILELPDIIGVRMIPLFVREINRLADIIRENFEVIDTYFPQDKVSGNACTQSCLQMVFKLPESWFSNPSMKKFKDMRVELQIRTIPQHNRSQVLSLLQYKQEPNIPRELKSSINRISALLELVDIEIERLLHERDNYLDSIEGIMQQEEDYVLNVDVLRYILDNYLPPENKSIKENYWGLLENLIVLDLNTKNKLLEIITTFKQRALEIDKAVVENMMKNYKRHKEMVYMDYSATVKDLPKLQRGAFLAHTGLIRLMLELKFGKYLWEVFEERGLIRK